MSPERAVWEFLVSVLSFMQEAPQNEFQILGVGRRARSYGSAKKDLGCCVMPGPVTERSGAAGDGLDRSGPVIIEQTIFLEVFASAAGGMSSSQDIVAGSDSDPSMLDLGPLVRDYIDYNLKLSPVQNWQWVRLNPTFETSYPKQIYEMDLVIETNASRFNRTGATFPAPRIKPA